MGGVAIGIYGETGQKEPSILGAFALAFCPQMALVYHANDVALDRLVPCNVTVSGIIDAGHLLSRRELGLH